MNCKLFNWHATLNNRTRSRSSSQTHAIFNYFLLHDSWFFLSRFSPNMSSFQFDFSLSFSLSAIPYLWFRFSFRSPFSWLCCLDLKCFTVKIECMFVRWWSVRRYYFLSIRITLITQKINIWFSSKKSTQKVRNGDKGVGKNGKNTMNCQWNHFKTISWQERKWKNQQK